MSDTDVNNNEYSRQQESVGTCMQNAEFHVAP